MHPTKRNRQVLRLLLKGFNIKSIAKELLITEKGVKWHLTNIYRLEGVSGQVELKNKLKQKEKP